MKLWLKLTILLTIILNVVIEIGILTITPKIESYSINLVGEKLKSISASISAGIDGEQFKNLDIFDSTSTTNPEYVFVQKTIETAKENLELTHDIYSISILDNNSISFGVVLNKVSFGKDTLSLLNKTSKEAAIEVYQNKKCINTGLYTDKLGSWLSGFSPIFDNNKNVVGIIKVDQNYDTVKSKLTEINDQVFVGRIILFPITIFLSFLLANIFIAPITKVKKSILKISSGDYSENVQLKSSGEIKELIDASENLRKTIIEQQQKIFASIGELEESKNKAEASDRMKSEFLALLSHEIRTPLNIILGNIEVLKLEFNDDVLNELKEITDEIKFGSDRLIRTVEMIVLYSELVSDSYSKKERLLNINQMFFEISSSYKEESLQKGIKILNECTATTGMIKADELLISEAIKQITDNAFKFTESGEIHFCIFDKMEEGISLVISDTGIGISEEFMKELFKPFRQEDMSYSRKFEGNGLGLAISKKGCDINGFELKISSEKNKGTMVEINIPKDKFFGAT